MTAQDLINPNLSQDLIKIAGIISSYRRQAQAQLQPGQPERLREYENKLRNAAREISSIVIKQTLDNLAPELKKIGEATEHLEKASGNLENVKEFLTSTAKLLSLVGDFIKIVK